MSSRAQRLVLLLLVGVFGWRVYSCEQQIAEKRRLAQQQTAAFESRTAEAISPLPLEPFARRAALAEAMRLRPDRRFLLAAGQIAALTGGKAEEATARFDGGRWTLLLGAEPLGETTELPPASELMERLVALAQRRLQAAPLTGDVQAARALQWEPEARATLPAALQRWKGEHRAQALHDAARAAVSLELYLADGLETDDALAAEALALAALDAAGGKANAAAQTAILTAALGYRAEAKQQCEAARGDDALRAFLCGEDAALAEAARLRAAEPQDRYLLLRRKLDRGDEKGVNALLDGDRGGERLDLATLALLLRERQQEHFSPVSFTLPVFLVAWAEGARVESPPRKDEAQTVEDAAEKVAAELKLEPDALSRRLEQALGKLDPGIADYLRAIWLSALLRQAEYFADAQADRKLTEQFAQQLAADPALTVQRFRRWFDVRRQLAAGQIAQGLAAADKLTGVGGGASARLIGEANDKGEYADPRVLRATRALAAKLDSRVAHRLALGRIAWADTQDLHVAARLLRSASAADTESEDTLREWLAALDGDGAALARIGADERSTRALRRTAFAALASLGKEGPAEAEAGLRRMIDEEPADLQTCFALAKQLRLSGRIDDAGAVLQQWLRRNDGGTIEAANARSTLSRYAFNQGKYEEGLAVVEPAVPVYTADALAYAALNLAGLGRAGQALKLADALQARYPTAHSLAVAAEVQWLLGDGAAAAAKLGKPPRPLSQLNWREEVGEPFAARFGDSPAKCLATARELTAAGAPQWALEELAVALDLAGKPQAAFELRGLISAPALEQQLVRVRRMESLRKAQGDAAATTWARANLAPANDGEGRLLALVAFREGQPALAWDVVPDPTGPGDDAETVWMLRSAALALEGDRASPARREALRAHYADLKSTARHVQLGRYLAGGLPEAEAAKLVTDLSAACEVPWTFGVRAEGARRVGDAADWYAVAVECGRRDQAEFTFAWNALRRLRSGPAPLAAFR